MIFISTYTLPESTVTYATIYLRLESGHTVRQTQARAATPDAAVREAVRMFRMTRADRKAA
jgi:hypothetical protein